ncbi:ribosomal protein S12 methylthiotransferase [Anaerovibrio lipolyticus DSM 3074]|uniref:Ribosomal protein uS12 methylthiotransferase RimO n=2 Tax=Anaerovibrio lipolyticus TaxID=82374 RepID=A0A0B2JZV5_9FIRM|nr:30S ribosomal protein S12 methylthiotransferase RimO [Anaerovibrio lipolyticus]KHM51492.1 ribosomal protein S12 methylthiotransferase [Anaerovibrio lipolyticus]SHI43546.1 ribosomal protein S12 methylthiotransferase [Anaerovibrio lipolyticus DSM 3074]
MKAGFVSLGCSKNLVDTEVMLGLIKEREIELVNDPSDADILIVNTCAFIQSAKEESINTILNMAEYKQPEKGHCKSLIIAGCLGQRYGQELLDELPEADGIIGTEAWGRVTEVIDETLKGNRLVIKGDETIYDASVPRIPTTPKHTAYVKIAEGCNNRCAFCAIPLIRGKYRSRKLEDIVAEVRNLVDKGVREIVLIAQDTTNYGHDIYGEPRLAQLLRELCKVEGIKWIRTLYNYPRFLNDELIEVMATEEKIVKYVDIPLQHASNEVLRRMRRPDTKEQITALLKKLRERVPGVVIRSTFIVGFPGETEEQFQELKDFIQEQRFDHAGFFTYSKEEDTPAANMDGQVDDDVMQDRYHEIKAIQSLISQEINESLVDQVLEVIVEGHTEDGTSYGRSYRQADDVDDLVYIEDDTTSKVGDIVKVRILQGFTEDLVGELAE